MGAKLPYGFSRQQADRLQNILDANGRRPAEFAEVWGISVSAANQDVARMRAKLSATSMAELLTKALRAGIIHLTSDEGEASARRLNAQSCAPGSGTENVYCSGLDSLAGSAYNVPILPFTRLSRIWIGSGVKMAPAESSRKSELLRPGDAGTSLARQYRRIDDPQIGVEYENRRNRNNAAAIAAGLPSVGSTMLNKYGIEWMVESHIYVPTPNTIGRWRDGILDQPDDLYPSVVPGNLSPRFTSFISAVDRCTAKTFILLDTTPELRSTAVPGSNSLDTVSNPSANFLFLDAARLHETVLAHEVGHAWVQYVDQCEDERVMEDVSDAQRLHQLHFVQSYVLDLKVNDVIRAKGFDMSPIENDQAASIDALCRAIQAGYRPPNRREEVFMALLLASQLLLEDRGSSFALIDLRSALERVRMMDTSVSKLAVDFAEAVREHGYQDRDSIRKCIDRCLLRAFSHTGDGIELEKDLVVPDIDEPNFDKYPQWIEGGPVRLKVEVGRFMAREDIPDGSRWSISSGRNGSAELSFILADGSHKGPWLLSHPYPFKNDMDTLRLMDINRKNRARIAANLRSLPDNQPPGNLSRGGRRHYLAGLGRFLTQARLQEQLAGEHPYAYAMNNPTTLIDPSGLLACSAKTCGQWYQDNWKIANKFCYDVCNITLCNGLPPVIKQACQAKCKRDCAKSTGGGGKNPPKWANCGLKKNTSSCMDCCDKACGSRAMCTDQCGTACCGGLED